MRRKIVVLISGVLVLIAVAIFFDAVFHGPYTIFYNNKLERIALSNNIVGANESAIEPLFGKPSSIYYTSREGTIWRSYNYAPFSILHAGVFQIHVKEGRVVAYEKLDD